MKKLLSNFRKNESGTVTVDFVVITAAVAGLGLAVALLILPNLMPVASGVQPALDVAPGLGADLILGQ